MSQGGRKGRSFKAFILSHSDMSSCSQFLLTMRKGIQSISILSGTCNGTKFDGFDRCIEEPIFDRFPVHTFLGTQASCGMDVCGSKEKGQSFTCFWDADKDSILSEV